MKTTPIPEGNPPLNCNYLRDISSVSFNINGLHAQFKGRVPDYHGDTAGLKRHIKKHRAEFTNSSVDGSKVAVFLAFKPSNRAQRKALATATGVTEAQIKGKCFTFCNRKQAMPLFATLEESAIKTGDAHWGYCVVSETLQGQLAL